MQKEVLIGTIFCTFDAFNFRIASLNLNMLNIFCSSCCDCETNPVWCFDLFSESLKICVFLQFLEYVILFGWYFPVWPFLGRYFPVSPFQGWFFSVSHPLGWYFSVSPFFGDTILYEPGRGQNSDLGVHNWIQLCFEMQTRYAPCVGSPFEYHCSPTDDNFNFLHRLCLSENGLHLFKGFSRQLDPVPLQNLVTWTHTQIYSETYRHTLLPDYQYTDWPILGFLLTIYDFFYNLFSLHVICLIDIEWPL